MRANPNLGGWGKQVRILDVTTRDGEIHPFYAGRVRARTLTPAASLAGHWAPSRQALGAAFGAMGAWPVTPAGRAAQAELVADGLCFVEPVPVLAILNELRAIELGDDEVVIHFENSGDHVLRTIPLTSEHPANVEASRHGHATGRWEGDTLVIDTIAFEPNLSGVALNVPSSADKHMVERLTLTDDRTRLRYEVTVTDPVYLSETATLTQQWDHRPDLEFSPPAEACADAAHCRGQINLGRNLPQYQKIVQTPELIVILHEFNAAYRLIYLDGRELEDDPNPTWNGHSVAHWEGDTLVILTNGIRDDMWLDIQGSPITESALVTRN